MYVVIHYNHDLLLAIKNICTISHLKYSYLLACKIKICIKLYFVQYIFIFHIVQY